VGDGYDGFFRSERPWTSGIGPNSKTYVSWWAKWSTPIGSDQAYFVKMIRFYNNYAWNLPVSSQSGGINAEPAGIYYYGGGSYGPVWTAPALNTWHHYEMMLIGSGDLTTAGTRVVYKIDGETKLDNSTNYRADYGMADVFAVWGYDATDPYDFNRFAAGYELLFGEFYADDTLARIEICDAQTESQAAHCEIQVPQNTWASGAVQFKANKGSFAIGQQLYLYVIDANGNVNSSGYQINFSGSTDTTPPSIPTNLSATVSGTQVSLSWTASSDNVGVAGYQILRSTTNGTGYAQIATSNSNSYTNIGLTAGTTYYYVVRAYDTSNNVSTNSAQAQATVPIPSDVQAPTTPSNLSATPSGTQIALSWTASTDNVGVSQYLIERAPSAGGTFVQIATSNTAVYTNTSLSQNTTYYYRVRAQDAASNTSAYSSTAQATTATGTPTPDTQNPTTPTNLSASASGTQISLTWTASTDNVAVSGYQILRSPTSGGPYIQIATNNTNSYTNTSLTVGTTYYYVVRAYDAAGNISTNSSQAQATTPTPPDTTAPSVPTSLQASASGTQISLAWTASTDNTAVTGYQILRSTTNGTGYQPIATSNTNSYTNTGLSYSTTYYYVVRAYDAVPNTSANSNQAVAAIASAPTSSVVINNISASTLVSGQSYTISGSGFGVKNIIPPIAYDNFETYNVGTRLNAIHNSGSPYSYSSQNDYTAPYNIIDTAPTGRPGKSTHFFYTRDVPTRYGYHELYNRDPRVLGSRYLMFDAWVLPSGPGDTWDRTGDGGVYQWKSFGLCVDPIAVWSAPPCAFNQYNMFTPYPNNGSAIFDHTTFDNWHVTMAPGYNRSYSPIINDGQWHHIRYYLDQGDPAIYDPLVASTYGREIVMDGSTILSDKRVHYPFSCLESLYVGLDNANGYTGHMDVYWDDMYFDNSWARLEICDSSTYSNCSHREIQIPHTTWNGSQIQFTANRGSFASGSAYLYVIDANGNVNSNGYAINF
jgi:fibronectin type 3 domain-containing protein